MTLANLIISSLSLLLLLGMAVVALVATTAARKKLQQTQKQAQAAQVLANITPEQREKLQALFVTRKESQ